MWRWIKRFFKRSKKHTTTRERTREIITGELKKFKHVVVIAGHEAGGGTTTYNGISENKYNSMILNRLMLKFTDGESVHRLFRKTPSYPSYERQLKRDLKNIGIDLSETLVLKFHLNDAGSGARGHEQLVVDSRSGLYAKQFAKNFNKMFGVILRRDEGVYYNPKRGAEII